MSFVDVPADAIIAFLKSKGFTERAARGAEIVFERAHKADPRYKVLVYSSVRRGNTRARAKGKDAIRVCAIFEDERGSSGVCKLPRVHRTGTIEGVFERVLERMRQAYERCSKVRPKLPRNPDGFINNCALRHGESVESCQICQGSCPDFARFDPVQEKHHPGSWPVGGRSPAFLEHAFTDDEGPEEP